MNAKMKAFADEWLTGAETGKKFNGRAAYEHAGYKLPKSNPSANASKLLRHPEVQEYIKERLDEHSMSATEVLLRFTEIARGEVGEALKLNSHGRLDLDHEKVMELSHLVKNFAYDSNGNPKVEFHDAMQALKEIARVHGMLKDGLEISGPGGAPVAMQVVFVNPDGTQADIAMPKDEDKPEPEDFSEFEEE